MSRGGASLPDASSFTRERSGSTGLTGESGPSTQASPILGPVLMEASRASSHDECGNSSRARRRRIAGSAMTQDRDVSAMRKEFLFPTPASRCPALSREAHPKPDPRRALPPPSISMPRERANHARAPRRMRIRTHGYSCGLHPAVRIVTVAVRSPVRGDGA